MATQGLPHFRNSKAAMRGYEPAYLNLFEVIFTPPPSVAVHDVELTEQVKKVSGLPEITPLGFVEQFYKFAKRTYAKAKPEDTTAELEIDFEVNLDDDDNMYVYNVLRQWSDLIFDPLIGKMSKKNDYVGTMTVNIQNRAWNTYRRFNFKVVYPIDPINPMDMDYTSEDIYVQTLKFKADYWEEQRKGQNLIYTEEDYSGSANPF